MPHADVHTLRMVDQGQEPQDIFTVIQRLSNAHQDNIGDLSSGIELRKEHLIQHLGRPKIPHLSRDRRGAEFAAHAAAHL